MTLRPVARLLTNYLYAAYFMDTPVRTMLFVSFLLLALASLVDMALIAGSPWGLYPAGAPTGAGHHLVLSARGFKRVRRRSENAI
jgi:hypothetical protein